MNASRATAATRRCAWLIVASLVLASGCASPPIDTGDAVLVDVDGPLGGPLDGPFDDMAPPGPGSGEATADAGPPRTGKVLWGGTILGVENVDDGTEIEVLAYPLDRRQRPMTGLEPRGRFLVRGERFLEPLDYAPGRSLTVFGDLDGTDEARIGEATRSFPVVRTVRMHLWRPGDELARPRFSIGVGIGIGN